MLLGSFVRMCCSLRSLQSAVLFPRSSHHLSFSVRSLLVHALFPLLHSFHFHVILPDALSLKA